jgi:hypothetical protein
VHYVAVYGGIEAAIRRAQHRGQEASAGLADEDDEEQKGDVETCYLGVMRDSCQYLAFSVTRSEIAVFEVSRQLLGGTISPDDDVMLAILAPVLAFADERRFQFRCFTTSTTNTTNTTPSSRSVRNARFAARESTTQNLTSSQSQ